MNNKYIIKLFSYLAFIPFLCISVLPAHAKYVTPSADNITKEQSEQIDGAVNTYNTALKMYNKKGLMAALELLSDKLGSDDKEYILSNFKGFPELPKLEKTNPNQYKLVFSSNNTEQNFEVIDFDNGVFKLNGQLFSYDKNLSLKENTNRIISLFQTTKSSSFNVMDLFIASAHAGGGSNNGYNQGIGPWVPALVTGLVTFIMWNVNKNKINELEDKNEMLMARTESNNRGVRRANEGLDSLHSTVQQHRNDFLEHVDNADANI